MFIPVIGGWRRHLLLLLGCDGLTLPWRTVYLKIEFWTDQQLRKHELAHVAQIDRMGPVWFSVVYLAQLAWYGYEAMPLEIEARRAELA